MTKQECEELILGKLNEIKAIYEEYNPQGNYLTMSVNKGAISANNAHWDEDKEKPLDVTLFLEDGDIISIH